VPTLRPGLWRLAVVFVGLLGIASSLIAAAVVTHRTLPWSHRLALDTSFPTAKSPVTYETTMVVEQTSRKVYPYSIVPGGADSVDEAKRAMSDPAIAAHYTDVDFRQLKQVKLATNIAGYVSYGWGDKIYWTSKVVTLRAGEMVFTDGTHIVRGRCLNRYSALPMPPIRPNEPTEQVLDTPLEIPVIAYSFPKIAVQALELPPSPEELTPTVPIFPSSSTPGKPGGGMWFPLIPIIPPIHHHPGSPTLPGAPPAIPPVAIVPEPNYIWILGAALLALLLANVWRTRTIRRVPTLSTENFQPGDTRVVEP
jgi:hypothetical protein